MGGVFATCAKKIAADVDVAVEVTDDDHLRVRRVLTLAALRLVLFALVVVTITVRSVGSSAISAPRAAAAAAITSGGSAFEFFTESIDKSVKIIFAGGSHVTKSDTAGATAAITSRHELQSS